MTAEDECPCSETSDASNMTSLQTDLNSTINSSETTDSSTGPCVKMSNNCTCKPDEKITASQARGPSPARPSGKSPSVNHQPQREPYQGLTQFDPTIQCLCHAYRVHNFVPPDNYDQRDARRFNWKWPRREYLKKNNKAYEVKVKRNHYRHYSKPHAQSDPTEGIPRKKSAEIDNLEPPKYTDMKPELEEITERIDIYYFDHGNSAYYRTTDSPPILATEKCAEKTDYAATRFWAEIFGTIHIGIAFMTAFILQLLRFILYSIIRPLTVGILQLLADYFIKPFLSIFFNALIQPVLILLYNIATSLRDLCEPIAEAMGFFLREIAAVFRALRIVEVNRTNNATTACT